MMCSRSTVVGSWFVSKTIFSERILYGIWQNRTRIQSTQLVLRKSHSKRWSQQLVVVTTTNPSTSRLTVTSVYRYLYHRPIQSVSVRYNSFINSSIGLCYGEYRNPFCPTWSKQQNLMLAECQFSNNYQRQPRRYIVSWLPEAMQSFSIWGGSGFLLKSLQTSFGLPYWACFAALSIGVRTMLFPLVLYAAHTASRFAKIAPDVQFQLSLFQKDLLHYRTMKANTRQIWYLMRTNMATLGATYKINKVNPLTVFLSPLIQIPIFYYVSIDMRKIVNGLDLLLAQNLVESSILWVPDLTEPDPWFGLPIFAGILLYGNMEIALGRNNLAGGTATSKADMAILLKDLFQSLAVFMPSFTSQLPAGVQIYICTSFCFTLVQSMLMRTESFRLLVGLPSLLAKPQPGRFTTEMMELKLLEQKAKELRGDGPILGKGVLIHGWEISFAGKYRPTTIQGSSAGSSDIGSNQKQQPLIPFRIQTSVYNQESDLSQQIDPRYLSSVLTGPYIHGVSAPIWQIQMQQTEIERNAYNAIKEIQRNNSVSPVDNDPPDREFITQYTDDVMEKANRGERPMPPSPPTIVDKPVRGVPYRSLQLTKKQKPATKAKKRR